MNGQMMTLMHDFVSLLLYPIIFGLAFMMVLAVWEIGIAIGERFWGLKNLDAYPAGVLFEQMARRRLERTDILTRVSPMLGLMGTLIPLGPGLSGLGQGDLSILTSAVTVAFDTTVLGLLAGIIGFVLGRLRRRWYDEVLNAVTE
ncbi:MAG TPA: MotA/TolQ/ExbB proton channel family protein [Nitrospirales bacterium]|nr:flagellar motor protein MotA [Nitrospiraceae bacterium]HNP30900.1 MotA/TolQ/ExbB proton channel family protein [Nitrospirales bacterium]